MKLRIQGDSLRLRIAPSEMTQLIQSGRVEDTIHFGPQPDQNLTYALLLSSDLSTGNAIAIRYGAQQVSVVVRAEEARAWANGPQVGLYGQINAGAAQLEVAVEKDFACLDQNGAQSQDTFPNPKQGAAC